MSENTRLPLRLGVRLCLAESLFHCRSIFFIYIVDPSGRDIFLKMAPTNRKVAVSRHPICCNCSSWVQFVSSGCGKTWAETRGESFCIYVQGMHRGEGFGERSGMAEADGGRNDGECNWTASGR